MFRSFLPKRRCLPVLWGVGAQVDAENDLPRVEDFAPHAHAANAWQMLLQILPGPE
jgi:hypothetical protein